MKKLAYVVSQFPELHETFILREIVELRKRGFDITVYSLKKCKDDIIHPEAQDLLPHTVYAPFFASYRVWKAVLFWLCRRPIRILTSFLSVMAMHITSPIALLKMLILWPKLLYYAYLMRQDHMQHVHAHWATIPASSAMLVSALLDTEWSLTAHAWDIFVKNPSLKKKIKKARFVFTCTEYNRKHLAKLVPEAASRIILMYHGVKLGQTPTALPHPQKVPLILTIGRLVETKGYPYLLMALKMLKQRNLKFQCVIVGQGNLEKFEALAKRFDIRDQVKFVGAMSRQEVQALYAKASVFALPSIVARNGDRDGIPNVIFEAMAAGLPIVSTQISGIPEAVAEGETGYLVPPKDAIALSDALEKILKDSAKAQEMGRVGQKRVAELFAEDLHMDKLVEAFDEQLETIHRVRVLLMIWSLEVGGAERVVSLLAQNLDADRFDVHVACLNHRGVLADELEKKGIPVHALHKKGAIDLGFLVRLIRLIRKEKIDLVHTHLWGANLWGRLAAWWTHRACIVTEHNVDTWKKPFHFWMDRKLAPWSRYVITVSNAVAQYYQEHKLPKGLCRVIPNGIDVNRFPASQTSSLYQELGWVDDEVVFAAIGRLVPAKNQKVFVESMAQVIAKHPQARALILGQGPLEKELKQQIEDLGLQGKVVMPGVRHDMPQILAGLKAVVFTSQREGLPMVLLEAMASGLPVVSTPVGGVPEVLRNDENGWLIAENDVTATTERLCWMIDHAEAVQQAGKTAQKLIRDTLSVSAMTVQHESLYLNTVKPIKRIVHIIDDLHGGGAQQQLYELVRNLPKDEWDPIVISLSQEKLQLADQFEQAGISVQCIHQQGKWSWSCFWELVHTLRALNADVVHTWLFTADLYGRLASRWLGQACVISSIRSVQTDKPKHYVWVDRFLKNITHKFIVNADIIQPVMHEREGVSFDKIKTVHNGIDLENFISNGHAQTVREELGLSRDDQVIGIVSRLMPVKDPMTFLLAARAVHQEMPQVKFVIVGDGELSEELQSHVQDWGLQGQVIFTGFRQDRARLLSAMDIVALSSLYEGCSNAILEAMAVGKPVVATDVGGNRELVRVGKSGYLVRAQDPKAMADVFKQLLRDDALRIKMGHMGRQLVEENFTLEQLVRKTSKVYRELLDKQASRLA